VRVADRLQGRDLALFRGDRCLFKGLEFAADAGELLVIEGPNGSGKTSLLRAIAGLLEFETGEVCWNGQSIHADYQAFRAETAWFSHRVGFKSDLTIPENLDFEAGLRATSSDRDPVFERLGLDRLLDLPFRALSAGQQRRAALARLLLSRATLWMMDEPFTNLDKAGQSLVVDLVRGHLSGGGTCLMASHQHIDVDGATRRVMLQ
jgi:heme exporter protein A